VIDVVDDGHCGFCGVTSLRDIFVDDYLITHYQLLKEPTDDDGEPYLRLIGSKNHFNEVKHTLIDDDGIALTPLD
jgi:hypothetical protein